MLVVLPTPPFWLATVMTRVRAGRGQLLLPDVHHLDGLAASRAIGVSNSVFHVKQSPGARSRCFT